MKYRVILRDGREFVVAANSDSEAVEQAQFVAAVTTAENSGDKFEVNLVEYVGEEIEP